MSNKFTISLILILIFTTSVFSKIDVNGVVDYDLRVGLNEGTYVFNDAKLLLKFATDIGDNINISANIQTRYSGFSEIANGSDFERSSALQPFDLQLDEARIKYTDFLIGKLDLIVGKQRIGWGRADKLNPTDNINPNDYYDIFDFGKKIPTNAILAQYSLTDFIKVAGIFIPYFTPARLPLGSHFSDKIGSSFGGLPVTSENIMQPEKKIDNAMFAFKIDAKAMGFDISLSYFNGYYDTPTLTRVAVFTNTTLSYDAEFPRMQVIGFDMAGQLFGLGVWFEMGIFIPKKATTLITGLGPDIVQTALDNTPYCKFTIGFDYTFKSGLYINIQWAHGLFTERGVNGPEELQDYLLANAKKKILNDKIQLMLLGGLGIRDLDDTDSFDMLKDNTGFVYGIELTFYPWDSTELVLGTIFLDGNDNTSLGQMRNDDQIYIKCKVSF